MSEKVSHSTPIAPSSMFGRILGRFAPPKSVGDGAVDRSMKYPYTISAKIAQFPWKFHYQNSWIFRYYLYSIVVCIPLFMKISSAANSPENKAKFAEMRRKEEAEHHDH